MLSYIDSFFELLCNLYDLDSHFYEFYFQNNWICAYSQIFDLFFNFNNFPEITIGYKYSHLNHFIKFFSLCMSKDNEFELRINLLKNNLSFLSKILMIATYCTGNCCCGHGFNNDSYSCQKAIDSIYKVMSYIEKNNDNYLLTKVKEIKIKYTDFLMRKYGKNICGVYLNKMAEICSNKDIFIYIINETNLLKEVMVKEVTEIHHSIECLEELVNLCENSEIFLHILIDLKNDDIILNKRLYREMLKKICSSSSSNNKLIFEKKIFNNILDLIFTTKTEYLTEIEGFFDVFFKSDSFSRLLYKKKLAIGEGF